MMAMPWESTEGVTIERKRKEIKGGFGLTLGIRVARKRAGRREALLATLGAGDALVTETAGRPGLGIMPLVVGHGCGSDLQGSRSEKQAW